MAFCSGSQDFRIDVDTETSSSFRVGRVCKRHARLNCVYGSCKLSFWAVYHPWDNLGSSIVEGRSFPRFCSSQWETVDRQLCESITTSDRFRTFWSFCDDSWPCLETEACLILDSLACRKDSSHLGLVWALPLCLDCVVPWCLPRPGTHHTSQRFPCVSTVCNMKAAGQLQGNPYLSMLYYYKSRLHATIWDIFQYFNTSQSDSWRLQHLRAREVEGNLDLHMASSCLSFFLDQLPVDASIGPR